ncbi:MAG TPA: hypothetical protein VLK84_01265 [Longimicrobium sp.]|nr:hypothetical protein [Longimicrobium sp.]
MEPLFRSIQVGDNLQLALGETIPQDVMNDMEKDPTNPSKYKFKSGEFSLAESITVTVDASQRVQRMDFGYENGMDYAWQLANFINQIGEPTGGTCTAPEAQQQSVWKDSQTCFVLWAKGQGSQSKIGSTLTNLAT